MTLTCTRPDRVETAVTAPRGERSPRPRTLPPHRFHEVLALLGEAARDDGQPDVAALLRIVAAAVERGRSKELAEAWLEMAKERLQDRRRS